MSINYAILGILSYKSLTGYDLKKIIQDSAFMHWSGNNNQIYKALVELLDEGLVTNEVCHQESSPSKKIYTITEEGKAVLREWILCPAELPEFKKTFLIKLAWAGELSAEELSTILSGYENDIRMQIILQNEKKRREQFSPDRNPREKYLWNMIHENMISSYENELNWLARLKTEIGGYTEEAKKMHFEVMEKDGQIYLKVASSEAPLQSEEDVLDLIGGCYEHNTSLIMLQAEALSDEFFELKTGLAGKVLQKFMNYQVKAALIIPNEQTIKGKFKELIAESKKGNRFRVFSNLKEAELWLLS